MLNVDNRNSEGRITAKKPYKPAPPKIILERKLNILIIVMIVRIIPITLIVIPDFAKTMFLLVTLVLIDFRVNRCNQPHVKRQNTMLKEMMSVDARYSKIKAIIPNGTLKYKPGLIVSYFFLITSSATSTSAASTTTTTATIVRRATGRIKS